MGHDLRTNKAQSSTGSSKNGRKNEKSKFQSEEKKLLEVRRGECMSSLLVSLLSAFLQGERMVELPPDAGGFTFP